MGRKRGKRKELGTTWGKEGIVDKIRFSGNTGENLRQGKPFMREDMSEAEPSLKRLKEVSFSRNFLFSI